MNEYELLLPDFVGDAVNDIYCALYQYGIHTAEHFFESFEKKLRQIRQEPFSCAVDQVYPSLTEMGVRKAVINHGRYLVLYLVIEKWVVVIAVERAVRDYITTFEANLRLYEGAEQRDE